MDERQATTEQLLREISTHLRHIKWIMGVGLAISSTLMLTVIGLTFFPVLVGLILAAFGLMHKDGVLVISGLLAGTLWIFGLVTAVAMGITTLVS